MHTAPAYLHIVVHGQVADGLGVRIAQLGVLGQHPLQVHLVLGQQVIQQETVLETLRRETQVDVTALDHSGRDGRGGGRATWL